MSMVGLTIDISTTCRNVNGLFCICRNVNGRIMQLGIYRNPRELQLLIDSSKTSMKPYYCIMTMHYRCLWLMQ